VRPPTQSHPVSTTQSNAKPDAIIINGIGTSDAADQYARVAQAGITIVGSFTGNDPGVAGVATEVAGDVCVKQSRQLARCHHCGQ